jgi:hypothetical protein
MDLNIPTRQRDSIQSQFDRFHEQNPHVLQEFVKLARRMKHMGFRHYGMHALMQITRWHIQIKTNDPHFKINNNYSSRYARLIVEQYPEFEGFFQMRSLTAE